MPILQLNGTIVSSIFAKFLVNPSCIHEIALDDMLARLRGLNSVQCSAPRSAWPDSGTDRLVHKDISRKGDKGRSSAGLTFNTDADRRSAVRPGKRSRSELSLGT